MADEWDEILIVIQEKKDSIVNHRLLAPGRGGVKVVSIEVCVELPVAGRPHSFL